MAVKEVVVSVNLPWPELSGMRLEASRSGNFRTGDRRSVGSKTTLMLQIRRRPLSSASRASIVVSDDDALVCFWYSLGVESTATQSPSYSSPSSRSSGLKRCAAFLCRSIVVCFAPLRSLSLTL